jgi:glycosyltransferase involved in cell wall biosynthesis
MPATVGIDASRFSTSQRTGTENYSRELLLAIGRLDALPWDLRLYTNAIDDQARAELERIGEVVEMPFPRFWTHGRLSWEMIRDAPDLLFVPSHVAPLRHPRTVVTIHDLGYLHDPEAHPAGQRRMLDWTTRWNARAAGIIAISETTRRDLIDRYGTDPDRIKVIHHGVNSDFKPVSDQAVRDLRSRYHLPNRFVLAVGTLQPRKNLGRLAQAIAGIDDLVLVTAGKRGWMADEVAASIRANLGGDRWLDLGYVPDRDLPTLITSADVVALVSTYEGFGLPVLEAMACGTPVVISDTPALVEIAGGSARIANRDDPQAIAACINDALGTGKSHDPFVAAGIKHAARFSWDRTAMETVSYLSQILTA